MSENPKSYAPVVKPLRYLSVCSGMEAASVAWHPLGWKPVGFSEIEPFPCAILKHRFPNIPNYGSLTEYQSWPLSIGDADLLCGGTPCQSFSVAGLRRGLADPRGNLALTFLGLADRLKPKWIVWENVPGVLSSGGGRDFGSFLGALVELGYGFAYRVLDAQHFGVPQRRRRVFVVACLGDWRAAAEVLSLREGLRGYLEAGGKKRKGVAADAGSGVEAGCWWDGGQVSQTLDAVLSKGQTMPEKNRFPAVLQPVSHWEGSDIHPTLNQSAKGSGGVGASNQELFSQGGAYLVPGAPITFRKSKRACSATDNETWVLADASNTLNNFDLGDTRTTHAVINNVAPTVTSSGPPYSRTGNSRVEAEALAITFQPGNLRREAGAEPSTTTTTTLKASAGDQTPHVCHPVERLDGMNLLSRLGECGEEHSMQNFTPGDPSFTLKVVSPIQDGREMDKKQNGLGVGQPGDPAYTLDTTGAQAIAIQGTIIGRGENAGPQGTGATEGGPMFTLTKTDIHGIATPMAVRRLTPVECERLQGFPDNWSRIPWRGKPETECPDGPRYKACGNSMAVPVMRWIGERIAAVEAAKEGKPSV